MTSHMSSISKQYTSRSHGFSQPQSLIEDYASPTGSKEKSSENSLFAYIDLLAKCTGFTTGELLHVAYEHMRRIAMKDARKSVIKVTVDPELINTWGEEGILRRCYQAKPPFDSIIAVQIPQLHRNRLLLIVNSYFDAQVIREKGHLLGRHLDARVWVVEPERFYIVSSNISAKESADKAKTSYKKRFPHPNENAPDWSRETGLNIEKAYWRYGHLWLVLQNVAEARAAVSGKVYSLSGFQTRFISKDPRYMVKQCFKCQMFNHMVRECPNEEKCGWCSENHLTKYCKNEGKPKYAICNGPHASYQLHLCNDGTTRYQKHNCSLYKGPAEWDTATMHSLLEEDNQVREQDSPMVGNLFDEGSSDSEMDHTAQVPLRPESFSIKDSSNVINHLYEMVTSASSGVSGDGSNAVTKTPQATAAPQSISPARPTSPQTPRLSDANRRSPRLSPAPRNNRESWNVLLTATGHQESGQPMDPTSPAVRSSPDAGLDSSWDVVIDTRAEANQRSTIEPQSHSGSGDDFTPVSPTMTQSDPDYSSDTFTDTTAQPKPQRPTGPHFIETLYSVLSTPEDRPDNSSPVVLESPVAEDCSDGNESPAAGKPSSANELSVTYNYSTANESSSADDLSATYDSSAAHELSAADNSLVACDSSASHESLATSASQSTFLTLNSDKEGESDLDISSTSTLAQPSELVSSSSSGPVQSPCRKKRRVWKGGRLSGHLEGKESSTVETTNKDDQDRLSTLSVDRTKSPACRTADTGGNGKSRLHPASVRTPSPEPKRVCRPWAGSDQTFQQPTRNMIQLRLSRPDKGNSGDEIEDVIVCAGSATTPEPDQAPPKSQPRQTQMYKYLRRERS